MHRGQNRSFLKRDDMQRMRRLVALLLVATCVSVAVGSIQDSLPDAEMTVLPKACMCVYGESYSTPAESLPETMRLSGIEGSYRPVSCARCAALSVFGVHNETVNIWTHLLGAPQLLLPVLIDTDSQSDSQTTLPLGVIRHPMNRMRRCLEQRCRGMLLMMWLAHKFYKFSDSQFTAVTNGKHSAEGLPPAWPLITFDLLASFTLFISVLTHTFACLPEKSSSVFWLLEQIGINIGVLGTGIVMVSYIRIRHPLQKKYLVAAIILATFKVVYSTTVFAVVSDQRLRRSLQLVLIFVDIGTIFGFLVKVWRDKHAPLDHCYRQAIICYALSSLPVLISGGLLLAGFPEIVSKGTFDMLGQSRQIMHMGVIASLVLWHSSSEQLWKALVQQAQVNDDRDSELKGSTPKYWVEVYDDSGSVFKTMAMGGGAEIDAEMCVSGSLSGSLFKRTVGRVSDNDDSASIPPPIADDSLPPLPPIRVVAGVSDDSIVSGVASSSPSSLGRDEGAGAEKDDLVNGSKSSSLSLFKRRAVGRISETENSVSTIQPSITEDSIVSGNPGSGSASLQGTGSGGGARIIDSISGSKSQPAVLKRVFGNEDSISLFPPSGVVADISADLPVNGNPGSSPNRALGRDEGGGSDSEDNISLSQSLTSSVFKHTEGRVSDNDDSMALFPPSNVVAGLSDKLTVSDKPGRSKDSAQGGGDADECVLNVGV